MLDPRLGGGSLYRLRKNTINEGYGLNRLRKKALIFLWASRLGAILAVLRAFPFAFAIYFRFAGCLAAYRDTAPFSWPSLEAE